MANYYGVWVGHKPGIYTDWDTCNAQVKGYKGAKFRKLKAQNAALAQKEFEQEQQVLGMAVSLETNVGNSIDLEISKSITNSKILPEFLSVDGAYNGVVCEYQGVWVDNGQLAFASKRFEGGTNNIAEFLGLVHAMDFLMQQNKPIQIYTDSVTAMAWVRDKKANTTAYITNKATSELSQLIIDAQNFLQHNAQQLRGAKILKWETKQWGQIPADYGRK